MSTATVTPAGAGWLVEWTHPVDGAQSYYTRDWDRAVQLAQLVSCSSEVTR